MICTATPGGWRSEGRSGALVGDRRPGRGWRPRHRDQRLQQRADVLVSDLSAQTKVRDQQVRPVDSESNRDGLGAVVRVVAGGAEYTKVYDESGLPVTRRCTRSTLRAGRGGHNRSGGGHLAVWHRADGRQEDRRQPRDRRPGILTRRECGGGLREQLRAGRAARLEDCVVLGPRHAHRLGALVQR